MKPCGVCGGSGGRYAGPDHAPGCFRYISPRAEEQAPPTRRERTIVRAVAPEAAYCPVCRGPHRYKHGRA